MVEIMENIEKIKEGYEKIKNKNAFIKKMALRFERKPSTIASQWMSRGFIPEELEKKVLAMINRELKKESK